jgi:hypothetical protein
VRPGEGVDRAIVSAGDDVSLRAPGSHSTAMLRLFTRSACSRQLTPEASRRGGTTRPARRRRCGWSCQNWRWRASCRSSPAGRRAVRRETTNA